MLLLKMKLSGVVEPIQMEDVRFKCEIRIFIVLWQWPSRICKGL